MNDATRWQRLSFQSVDGDGDGTRANATGDLCVGSALPSTHSASLVAAGDVDCNDNDALSWQLQAYTSRDADSDGFSIAESGEICVGAGLPPGYGRTPPQAIPAADCDDANATAWRFMTTYSDADDDGVGAGAGQVSCIGTGAPSSRSLLGYDPVDDPSNPNAGTVSNVELPSWLLEVP